LEEKEKVEVENRVEERSVRSGRKRKEGPVDHEMVFWRKSSRLWWGWYSASPKHEWISDKESPQKKKTKKK